MGRFSTQQINVQDPECWDRIWGPGKPIISHGGSGLFDLESIPDNFDFNREGSIPDDLELTIYGRGIDYL